MAAIQTRGLTKFYGSARGIEDLDLAVQEGEAFGFLGPNGAGKTTTIRLILGLLRPTRGEIQVLNAKVDKHSWRYRAGIGYLPGELGLYGHLRVSEFLARMGSLRGTASHRKTTSLAGYLQLDLSRRIKDLSHGTKQKAGIVQAFMHDAQLLVLDEPTNGLDPIAQQTFFRLVEEERARGRTIFLSSHRLGDVERICSRVALIRGGRLVVVEDILRLKQKRMKWIDAELAEEPAVEEFEVQGVRSVKVEATRVRLAVEGDYAHALRALTHHAVVDITIRDATLEEIFLEYYSGEPAKR